MRTRAPCGQSFLLSILIASIAGSACSGGGCGGCAGGGNYTFPADRVEQRILRARMSQAGLDFLKPRIKDLMKSLLGVDQYGRVKFTIPAAHLTSLGNISGFGGVSVDLEDDPNTPAAGDAGWAAIDFSSMDVQLVAGTPPKVLIKLRDALVDADVRILASWSALGVGGDAACYIRGAVDRGTARQRALLMDLDVEVTLAVDSNGNLTPTFAFPTLNLRDLQVNVDAAPDTDPRCDDGFTSSECAALCGTADFITGIVTSVTDFLTSFLNGIIRQVLPPIIQQLMAGRSLKFQGQISLSSFVGALFANASPFGYLMVPTQDGFVVDGTASNQGLTISMNGGLESSPASKCAPELTPLPIYTPGPFPALGGVDTQGHPYHVGLSIADAFLNEGGVAAYTSGALCISLSSGQIYSLTGGRFNLSSGAIGLLVPGLRELAGDNAPLLIQITPTDVPKFQFGSGQGTGEQRDSLIQMQLKGMHLGFYALMNDRYARLFEFNADIAVGITIVVQPDNSLQVAVDKVSIDKLTQTYNELFRNSDLQSALRLIVNLATSALLGQGINFNFNISRALPPALAAHLGIRVNEIVRDGTGNDFLTIALSFTDPSMSASSAGPGMSMRAAVVPGDEAMAVDVQGRRIATGRVALDVGLARDDGQPTDGAFEYQWSVDGAQWSGFAAGPRVYVEDPRLLVIGHHEVRVRARKAGSVYVLGAEPAAVRFTVDPVAPRLRLEKSEDGSLVVIDARDELTPRERVEISWRMDEGAWSDFAPVAALPVGALPDGELVSVRARDEMGNVSGAVSVRVRATHGRTTGTGGTTPGCGGNQSCASGGGGDFSFWGLALLATIFAGRRRRARGVVAMLAIVLLGAGLAGCGDDKPGNTCTEDAQCPSGFRCVEDQCTVITRCDDPVNPTPCCPGQTCSSAGTCIDVLDKCQSDGTCDKPGKVCSTASAGDGGAGDAGMSVADAGSPTAGICTYKSCTADNDCMNGSSCFNGFCRQPTPCGGGCGPSEVCVTPTDSCYPAPAQCLTLTCGAGQIRVMKNVTAQIGAGCNLKNVVCECADIPQIPRGDWGRDSHIAVLDGGLPIVSAYDKTYGDLVCARYDATGALQKLEYVDGVPTGVAPTGRPSGIRGGVTAPGPNVGRYTSIAVDSTGNPLIAYYDIDNADLKLAAYTGTAWVSHTIDAAGDVGRYARLAIGPGGIPHVAYFQKAGDAADRTTALKLARAKNASPRAATDWDVMVIDTLVPPAPPALPCGGTCNSPSVCISQSVDGGAPTQRCVTPDSPANCSPACASAQACVSNRCVDKVPAPAAPLDDLPEGVGLFPSIAFSPAGVFHVAYYDRTNGNLKGARAASNTPHQPSDFQKAVIDGAAGTFVDGDVGLFPSLAFLADGKMAIAYEDATNDDLVFYVGSDFTGGAREVVDRGQTGTPLQLVGANAALAVAPSGDVFVAYQDATFNDLKLGRRTTANNWTLDSVLSEGAWGFFADLVITGGKLYMSNLKFGFDLDAQPANELRVVIRPLP